LSNTNEIIRHVIKNAIDRVAKEIEVLIDSQMKQRKIDLLVVTGGMSNSEVFRDRLSQKYGAKGIDLRFPFVEATAE
jgi:tRNA A37 threonylcarbamoyltransferase TsaD